MQEASMAPRRRLTVSAGQREALVAHRDHDPRPDVRERCAALVKIADGLRPHAVARGGLLNARDPDTVYGWLTAYEAAGLAGLRAHRHRGPRRGCYCRPPAGGDAGGGGGPRAPRAGARRAARAGRHAGGAAPESVEPARAPGGVPPVGGPDAPRGGAGAAPGGAGGARRGPPPAHPRAP